MERYIIKLINGTEYSISEDEYKNLIGKTGLIFFKSLRRSVNTTSISEIVPESVYHNEVDRSEQREGILHDGTRVVRYFGSWYLDGDINENGKPQKIIDPQYYPEIARDCVPNPREYFQKYANLPQAERLKLITMGTREPQKGDFLPIKDSFNELSKKITN